MALFGRCVGYTLGPVPPGERVEDLLVRLPSRVRALL